MAPYQAEAEVVRVGVDSILGGIGSILCRVVTPRSMWYWCHATLSLSSPLSFLGMDWTNEVGICNVAILSLSSSGALVSQCCARPLHVANLEECHVPGRALY